MKIAVWHNLPSGGGKRALYYHVKALQAKGHFLEAWTTDISSEDYLPLSDLIIENRKKIKEKYETLWRIKNPIRRVQKTIKLFNDHCIECVREIESREFDMIFAGSCEVSYMPYIAKFTKLPAIVYLGEPYRPLYEAIPENLWKAQYQFLKLIKIKKILGDFRLNYSRRIKVLNEIEAAKTYQKILVNSLFSRENVIRSYGTDATVCYLGIDTDFYKPEALKKESYVVGLGTISFLKSVYKAIEIIANIPAENRPVLKWIANGFEKTYLEEIKALAERLEVNFQYYLNVSDSELINIVSRAAIMIYIPRLEPFGLAPLEANACGTYVVAIAEGGIRESITNGVNGILINGFKIKEFSDVISLFINDLDYAKTKGIEARIFVEENWNEQFMTNNILFEIESVLKYGSTNIIYNR